MPAYMFSIEIYFVPRADIDECSNSSDDCDDSRATCTNTIGSYTCSCNFGYSGTGFTSQCSELPHTLLHVQTVTECSGAV